MNRVPDEQPQFPTSAIHLLLQQILTSEVTSISVVYPSGLKFTVEFPPPQDDEPGED